MRLRSAACLWFVAALQAGPGAQAAEKAPGYVVTVDYVTDAAHFEALKTLVDAVARASIAEPGCRRFDVVQPASLVDHLFLYEIFDDEAAFRVHAASSHFKLFAAESAKIKASRMAMPGSLLFSLSKP